MSLSIFQCGSIASASVDPFEIVYGHDVPFGGVQRALVDHLRHHRVMSPELGDRIWRTQEKSPSDLFHRRGLTLKLPNLPRRERLLQESILWTHRTFMSLWRNEMTQDPVIGQTLRQLEHILHLLPPKPAKTLQSLPPSATEIDLQARRNAVAWSERRYRVNPDLGDWKKTAEYLWGMPAIQMIGREFELQLNRERQRLEAEMERGRRSFVLDSRQPFENQDSDRLTELAILKKQVFEGFAHYNQSRIFIGNQRAPPNDYTFKIAQSDRDFVSLIQAVWTRAPFPILKMKYAPDTDSSGPLTPHLYNTEYRSFLFPNFLEFVFQPSHIRNVGYGELVRIIEWLERMIARKNTHAANIAQARKEISQFSDAVFDGWFYEMFAPLQKQNRNLIEMDFFGYDLVMLYAVGAIKNQPDHFERRENRASQFGRPDLNLNENNNAYIRPEFSERSFKRGRRKTKHNSKTFTQDVAQTSLQSQTLGGSIRPDRSDDPLVLKIDRWLFNPKFVFLTEDRDPQKQVFASASREIDPVRDVRVRMVQAQEISSASTLSVFTPPHCELIHIQVVDAQNQAVWNPRLPGDDERKPGYTIWQSTSDGGYVINFDNSRRQRVRYVATFRRIESEAAELILDPVDLVQVRERIASVRLGPLNEALNSAASAGKPVTIKDLIQKFSQLSYYAKSFGTTSLPKGEALTDFQDLVTKDQTFFGNCVAGNRLVKELLKDSLAKQNYVGDVRRVIAFQNGSYYLGRDLHAVYMVHRGPSEIFWLDATPTRGEFEETLLPKNHTSSQLRRSAKRGVKEDAAENESIIEENAPQELDPMPENTRPDSIESLKKLFTPFADYRQAVLEHASHSGLTAIPDEMTHPLWEIFWLSGIFLKLTRHELEIDEFKNRVLLRYGSNQSHTILSIQELLPFVKKQVDRILNHSQVMETWSANYKVDPDLLPMARGLVTQFNRLLHDPEVHVWFKREGTAKCVPALIAN